MSGYKYNYWYHPCTIAFDEIKLSGIKQSHHIINIRWSFQILEETDESLFIKDPLKTNSIKTLSLLFMSDVIYTLWHHSMSAFKMLARGGECFLIHFGLLKKLSNSAVVGYQTRGSEKSESVSHETLVCFDELLAEREWTQPSNILPQHSLGPPQPWHGCWWNTIFTIRKGPGPPTQLYASWAKKTLGQYKGAL